MSSIAQFESMVMQEASAVKGVHADNPFAPAAGLWDIIRNALDQLKDDLPPKQEVLDYVGRFYDMFIQPIDLPGVPNFGPEQIADKLLKAMAISAIGAAYDRLMGS